MVYHLLKGLQRFEGLDSRVILLNKGRLSEEIHRLGIRVDVVEESKNSLINTLRIMRRILLKEKERPTILHSHGYKVSVLSYLISKSINPVKLVATQHGTPKRPGKIYNPRNQLVSKLNSFLLLRYFHRVIAVSKQIKETFVKDYRFGEEKVSVIHNGVEIPQLPAKSGNSEYFTIGSSGRLFPVKDYILMVEIAKAVLEKTDRVRFQLAGDGPEKTALKALSSRYHLDDVFTFKGYIEDTSPFYQGLDLYLNTSINEGIPISVLEAMARKLPVIAPKVGGLPEIIDDGVQGYLLEERNAEAFAEKCLFLYENKSLRQRMSEAAREKVEQRFSMERMVQDYFNLYINLAEGR